MTQVDVVEWTGLPGVLLWFILSVCAVAVTTVVDIVRSEKNLGDAWGDFSPARWVAWAACIVFGVLSFTSPTMN